MTSDHDALFAAVLAAPADDLPRLVYADWVEEHGDPARAGFIRGQVELARTPPWEPFAVRARWFRADDLVRGRPWVGDLPPLGDGRVLGWDPEFAYRRGFGWGLAARQPGVLVDVGDRVFAAAPVGRLALWAATLADWRAVAGCPWLARVTHLHFPGLTLPAEALWVLAESRYAGGLTDVGFGRADSPGMPEVVARLMRSGVGPRLTGLRFRTGCDAVDEMIDALAAGAEPPQLADFGYAGGNLTPATLRRLLALPAVGSVTTLGLFDNRLGAAGARVLAARVPAGLADLDLRHCALDADAAAELAAGAWPAVVRRLDLGRNPLGPDGVAHVAAAEAFAGVRSLGLHQVGADDRAVAELTRGRCWATLVELDLRQNPITEAGAGAVLAAPVPPDFQVLRLDGHLVGDRTREDLRRHLGDRILFGEPAE